jgi:ankyrin repeat protein
MSANAVEVMKFLLGQGFTADELSPGNHELVLQTAALNGHTSMVELLLKYGADINAEGGRNGQLCKQQQ